MTPSAKIYTEKMSDRIPPFCCPPNPPSMPFHKQEHYPRSYTCLLNSLSLATSLLVGLLPPTHLTKPLKEHAFVIRLCKGHTNPLFGLNKWGVARYFLPSADVSGGLIEVLNVKEDVQRRTWDVGKKEWRTYWVWAAS